MNISHGTIIYMSYKKSLLKISAFYTERDSFLIRNHLRLYISHISTPI